MTESAPTPTLGPGPAVLAIDVGGTQVKAAVLDDQGRLRGVTRRPTQRSAADPGGVVVAAAAQVLDELRAAGVKLAGVCMTVPGIVDEEHGIGVRSTNLGWRDYPFRDRLEARIDLPCAVTHDVRAAAEAEARLGAARGFGDAAVVTIGTGVAAALRFGGTAYTGRGYAGELGHVVVDPSGPDCACGRRGCLEAIGSAAAIVRSFRQRGSHAVENAADIVELVRLGDPDATEVWARATSALGVGLSLLVAIIAPEVIVLGGGLSEAGSLLIDPVQTELADRCSGLSVPRLVRAELGEDAGTWGAAILARATVVGVADPTETADA